MGGASNSLELFEPEIQGRSGKRYQRVNRHHIIEGPKWQAKIFLLYPMNDKVPLKTFKQRSDKIIILDQSSRCGMQVRL